jgi:hypothetical protein
MVDVHGLASSGSVLRTAVRLIEHSADAVGTHAHVRYRGLRRNQLPLITSMIAWVLMTIRFSSKRWKL